MKTLLLILGKETNEFAKGNYNQGLVFLDFSSFREADAQKMLSLASNPG